MINKNDTEHQLETKTSSKKNVEDKVLKKKTKKKPSTWLWPVKILILTLVLSLSFSIFSEYMLSGTGIAVSLLLLIPLIIIAVVSDMIGVAVAAASIEPFTAMAARKVRGAKESLMLIKNADKVSSICNDVIGDVCGILSGAIGMSLVASILVASNTRAEDILITSAISATIAGLTVFGKALAKKYAIKSSTKIVSFVGKVLSVFSKKVK